MNSNAHHSSATLQPVELAPLSPPAPSAAVLAAPQLAALAGVKTQVQVLAGSAHITVGELLNLKEGTLLTLGTPVNDPFDIVVNGTVIARGELVAVGEHFGIRVTQVAGKSGK